MFFTQYKNHRPPARHILFLNVKIENIFMLEKGGQELLNREVKFFLSYRIKGTESREKFQTLLQNGYI